MSKSKEAAQWDKAHKSSAPGGQPSRLFTDDDPATTIKGCGFKDAQAAERTLWLTSQPGSTHKQYWSIRAMAERAGRHPAIRSANSSGMRDALRIFRLWLDSRGRGGPTPPKRSASSEAAPVTRIAQQVEELHASERAQRVCLTKTKANAHAKRNCSSEAEFAARSKQDRRAGSRALKEHAGGAANKWFALPATAFVAIFGGPGEHGYGRHTCESARAAGLPNYRCVCAFNATHRVTVLNERVARPGGGEFTRDAQVLKLGKRFSLREFALEYDGGCERGRYLRTAQGGKGAKRQAALTDFFFGKQHQQQQGSNSSNKRQKKRANSSIR